MMLRKMENTKDKLRKKRRITAKGCDAATALAGNSQIPLCKLRSI